MICQKGTPILETDRLILRPFAPSDADSTLKNWAGDPLIFQHISAGPYTADSIRDWLSTAEKAYSDPQVCYWAIVEKASCDVIGEIFVDDFSIRNQWCELDWKIGSGFQCAGYGTEAAKVAISYLSREVGFHRIQAKCSLDNPASARIMEKLGMQREGLLRDYFGGKDGRFHHVVLYALISSE